MKITEQEVRYVADLANLKLSDEEVGRMVREMEEILNYVDKLNELDTSGVEPMAQVLFETDEQAGWREDVEHVPLGTEAGLANAPLSGAGYFKVPRVIER
ncbi:MAG: Asp-tRNA(Asn)/Glu-tRNA(Gln) amidotransferase subunit GatC [Acidobacteria bacterium]|nr:Asp-tRNA(Asn)/Glu-tRNA(Gln) amidotransferase subunit GatC [Acidobacteriota bacterium]MBI3279547.1 Asp-tRNA(Asn)/Glu-tRNA(Gln) amidotransferase subunit GatC [Acidobacteriota bacterium]